MIDHKKVLAIIPARGGSKGLPRKNILPANDKPLVAWTISEAKKSKYIDRLILSSEDEEIINIAKKWGCDVPFPRPQHLATDEASTMSVILHVLDNIPDDYDLIVVLQPTSPLRSTSDIDNCIQACHTNNAPSCVTVTKADKHPFWMYYLNDDNSMTPVLDGKDTSNRRQDLPRTFVLNGAVYVSQREFLLQHKTFIHPQTISRIMPQERSLDIDTEFDFKIFKALVESNNL